MDPLFNPRSIAVIGVSDDPANLGQVIAANLERFGFGGPVYLVGRRAGSLGPRPIVTMEQLPAGEVDLAVILTPAATVPAYLEACGQKGIRWAVIESGGFSEFSPAGRRLEEECLEVARRYGLRFVGPNCLGISSSACGLATSFLPTQPGEIRPGQVAIVAQSGGVILTCVDTLSMAGGGLGVSKTVSVGNKADLKEADYLRYFLDDPHTAVVVLYLESILNGRELVDLARGGRKPVLVFKSNTGPASARAAASHTAALANDEKVIDAAFKGAGILRLRRFAEMATFGKVFSLAPVRGRRLAVFSRSGGHAIVAADAASEFGFDLPPFSLAVLEAARPYFRASIMDTNNPLDLGTVFDFLSYPVMVEACLKDMRPDAVLLIFNFRRGDLETARQVAQRLAELSRQYATPIALVYFTEADGMQELQKTLNFPVFSEVYEAMQALAAGRDFELSRQDAARPPEPRPALDAGAAPAARRILETCRQEKRQPRLPEALEICALYGIPVARAALVGAGAACAAQAAAAAAEVGYPLALKAVAGALSHKSDAGGVILGISSPEELAQALADMAARLAAAAPGMPIDGYLLQKMAPPGGRELILGGKRDPAFGPLVLAGLGGIYAEILGDTALRLAPLGAGEARRMFAELRGRRLLEGARRQAPADLDFAAECAARLSCLLEDLPEIEELDLNPLLVYPQGGLAVDARIGIKV